MYAKVLNMFSHYEHIPYFTPPSDLVTGAGTAFAEPAL